MSILSLAYIAGPFDGLFIDFFFSKGFMEDFNSFKSNMPIKEWLEYFIYLFKFFFLFLGGFFLAGVIY